MMLLVSELWVICAILVGHFGMGRKTGFMINFLITLCLSHVVGLLVLLFTTNVKSKE